MAKRTASESSRILPHASEQRGGPSILSSRLMVLIAGVGGFLVLGQFYAQQWLSNILLALFTDGAIAALWGLTAAGLGYVILKLMRVEAKGPLGLATAAALGLGVYSLVALGLGLAGWLNRGTTIAMAGVSVVAFYSLSLRERAGVRAAEKSGSLDVPKSPHPNPLPEGEGIKAWLLAPAGWGWLWLLTVPSVTVMILGACILPGWLWKPLDPHPYDVMVYHLQVPREWYEAGRIVPLVHNIYSYFPYNAEMHYLMAMYLRGGPWAGMYLAQFMSVLFTVLTLIGLVGSIPGDSPKRTGGIIAAVLVMVVPWVPMLSAVAYVESALLLYLTLALAWLMRAIRSPEPTRAWSIGPWMVAGVLAGFASGVKYTGVPTVLLALPAAFLLIRVVGRGGDVLRRRSAIRGTAVFVVAGLLVFSPWMIRNWAWVGNPVFPMEMRHLGQDSLSDVQVERWDRAHRAPEHLAPLGARLWAGWNGILRDWQYGYVLIPAALVAVAIAFRRREMWLLGLLLLMQFIFWMGFTHLAARFAVLLVPIAAMMVGVALASRPMVGTVLVVLATVGGFWGLHARFNRSAEMARQGLFLLNDIAILNPPEIAGAMKDPTTKIALIGDGQAFFYPLSMSRLTYRVIFNIDFPKDPSVLDAWLGRDIETLRKDGHIVVIDADEIRRLAKTYWQVPTLPAEWESGAERKILPPK